MSWSQAMRAAFRGAAVRGRWWLVALATFLVRGGLVALLPAIVVLPTPAELAVRLDPSLTGDAPGDVTPGLVELVVRLLAIAATLLLATTVIGVRLEADLVEAAANDDLGPIDRAPHLPLGQAVLARLVTHLPTLAAVVFGGVALAEAAYAELLSPSGPDVLPLRMAARAPLAVAFIVATWLLGETWGGLALRRLATGEALGSALGRGLAGVVRPSGLATLALGCIVVGLPLVVLWLTAARAFDRLWPLVVDGADPSAVAIALGLLVATWGAGLWLLAIGLAIRSAAWTAEGFR
jgi:hypothetical protein